VSSAPAGHASWAIWITRTWWRGRSCSIPVHAAGALFEVGDGQRGTGQWRGGHHGARDLAGGDVSVRGAQDLQFEGAARGDADDYYIAMG